MRENEIYYKLKSGTGEVMLLIYEVQLVKISLTSLHLCCMHHSYFLRNTIEGGLYSTALISHFTISPILYCFAVL